jgi:hypothetical protein
MSERLRDYRKKGFNFLYNSILKNASPRNYLLSSTGNSTEKPSRTGGELFNLTQSRL